MAQITRHGNPIPTDGELPKVGGTAPNFRLLDVNLNDVTLAGFKGKDFEHCAKPRHADLLAVLEEAQRAGERASERCQTDRAGEPALRTKALLCGGKTPRRSRPCP